MMTAGVPAASVRAEEFADEDWTDDELNQMGHVGTGGSSNKATAYSNLPWYANTGSTVNTGRGANKIVPNTSATGDHVVYKADATTGEVTNYTVYTVNSQNPSGFDEVIRYDGTGNLHYNSVTGEKLMPHVHDKTVQGGIRAPYFDEIL